MDYNKFVFKNCVDFQKLYNYGNIFFEGHCGSGKTVLLHQLVKSILDNDKSNNYHIYIDDPKMVAFSKRSDLFSNDKVTYIDDVSGFANYLTNEFERRKTLSQEEMIKETRIIYVCDEIADSKLQKIISSYYGMSVICNIYFYVASQISKPANIFEPFCSGCHCLLNGNYGEKDRSLTILNYDLSCFDN